MLAVTQSLALVADGTYNLPSGGLRLVPLRDAPPPPIV